MSRSKSSSTHYQSALSVVALVLIILMAVAAILVQQAVLHSQNLKQQATSEYR